MLLLYTSSSFTLPPLSSFFFFFFNDTATTEIYTLSLHDALPISRTVARAPASRADSGAHPGGAGRDSARGPPPALATRSEEHTSELQSQSNLVCRLLLEKKKKKTHRQYVRKICAHTQNTSDSQCQ